MNAAQQFFGYNLLPALLVGVVAWVAIGVSIRLLGVRHGKLRLCLLSVPLVKSTLVLLGMGVVLPWPQEVFVEWQRRALGPEVVLPWFALFTGGVLVVRATHRKGARQRLLAGAVPGAEASPRLADALDQVMAAAKRRRGAIAVHCGHAPRLERPALLVAAQDLASPAVLTDDRPAIVFPAALIDRLDDAELRGALAHEIAHLELRPPFSCFSAAALQGLALANPLATIMAAQLWREEEKACDDMAVAATGDPQTYAGMLLKAYRFSRPGAALTAQALQYVPQLLGLGPSLSERVERLLDDRSPCERMGRQYLGFVIIWIGIIAVFFTA